jgi:hypothetical protein
MSKNVFRSSVTNMSLQQAKKMSQKTTSALSTGRNWNIYTISLRPSMKGL